MDATRTEYPGAVVIECSRHDGTPLALITWDEENPSPPWLVWPAHADEDSDPELLGEFATEADAIAFVNRLENANAS